MKGVTIKNRKFCFLTIAMLPMICLLAFTGCSTIDPLPKNDTAVTDRTSYYLDGHAKGF